MSRKQNSLLAEWGEDKLQEKMARLLSKHSGNKAAVARELGVHRQAVQYWLEKWKWARKGAAKKIKLPKSLEQATVSTEAWVDALLCCDNDVSRYQQRVCMVEQWLENAEQYGHVSAPAALGLKAILRGG